MYVGGDTKEQNAQKNVSPYLTTYELISTNIRYELIGMQFIAAHAQK